MFDATAPGRSCQPIETGGSDGPMRSNPRLSIAAAPRSPHPELMSRARVKAERMELRRATGHGLRARRSTLDGHESDEAELSLFEKHANRIALHREIWDQVLTKVTQDVSYIQANEG
jgi:hypothetical protein